MLYPYWKVYTGKLQAVTPSYRLRDNYGHHPRPPLPEKTEGG